MDFWIIRDGEKEGPFPDYEIRSRIDNGELGQADPVWGDGMSGWSRLGDVELFRTAFERPPVQPPPLPVPVVAPPAAWRRFLARMFDFVIYDAVVWSLMAAVKVDLKVVFDSPWFAFLHLVPWFLLEIGLIHRFGTTPGKALVGLSIRNADGSKLSPKQSAKRAILVLFAGVGLGFSLLFPFCMAISWFSFRRIGTSLWDFVGGHQIIAKSPSAGRIIALVLLFFTAMQVQGWVLRPVTMAKIEEMVNQGELPPWVKEAFEGQQVK